MFFTNIDPTTDINHAMIAASHDFTVRKEGIRSVEDDYLVPDHMIVRKNDQSDQYLGTVGIGWEPVQPETIYELASELMDATDGRINGVFTMNKGAVIGIQINLGIREYVAGDTVELNFIMVTSFNGAYAVAGHSSMRRISNHSECNTSNRVYGLKHTRNVANRLKVVKDILKYYHREIREFDEKMEKLVNHRMTEQEAIEWFRGLHPAPRSPRSETALDNKAEQFLSCLQGVHARGIRGTTYAAFSALTDYISHHRTTRVHEGREEDEVRFQSIHFGSGNDLVQKGLKKLMVNFTFSEDDFTID